jgi:hypothetical protein
MKTVLLLHLPELELEQQLLSLAEFITILK